VLERIEAEYRRRTPRSAEEFRRSAEVIPGGASRSLVLFSPHPPVMVEGKGARFTDLDGNEYIDFVNCHTALVHGHAHAGITAAIQRQAARGAAWSAASELEPRLASMLCRRIASIEKIRFCCSGTEAGMYALRLARAFTGREKILKFEGGFHGSYDDVEISKTLQLKEAPGLPRDTAGRVVVAPFNDRETTERQIERHRDDLAAVIVEPLLGAGGMIAPAQGFLPFLREITRRYGIVLIADEVVSLRLAFGGAQERYGFDPDLTMLGKIIGGGLPVAAVGGRADILELSSQLSLSGTFSGAAIGMAAGIASMQALDGAAIDHINALGERMQDGIRAALREAGIVAQVTGVGSLFGIHFTADPVTEHRAVVGANRALANALHLFLLTKGISIYSRGAFTVSTAMTDADVDAALRAIRQGLLELKPHIHRRISGGSTPTASTLPP
jgi:glutamate-1-semialdehyde 2,1-aminomutase